MKLTREIKYMLQLRNKGTKVSIENTPKADTPKAIKPSKKTTKKNGIGAWLTQEDYDLFVKKRDAYGFTNNSAFLKTIITYDHLSMKKDIDNMKSQVNDLHQSFHILITDIHKVLQLSKSNVSSHSTYLPSNKSIKKEE